MNCNSRRTWGHFFKRRSRKAHLKTNRRRLEAEPLELRTLLSVPPNLDGISPASDLENAALKAIILEAANAAGFPLPADVLIAKLINNIGLGWHYVDPNNPYQSVTGQVVTHPDSDIGVTGSQVSFTDFPSTHLSHDQNFILHVDPGFENLVSQYNEGPSDENGDQRDMEIEWETGIGPHKETHGDGTQGANGGPIFPKWVWPSVGDRVWLNGAWIYDLGHPIPIGLEKFAYRSEIHPPRAIAVMRNQVMSLPDTNGVPINVVATNLYIHGDGGLAPTVEQEGAIPTILNPFSYDLNPINGQDCNFEFDIQLPAMPSADATITTFMEQGPGNTINIEPILTPMPGQNKVHVLVPLAGTGVTPEDVSAWRIYAGWNVPAPSVHHVVVTLQSMLVKNDKDPDFLFIQDHGELSFFWLNVNKASTNEWIRLQDHTNFNMDDTDDGATIHFNDATFDFYVSGTDTIRIQANGYDQDAYDNLFDNRPFNPLAYALDTIPSIPTVTDNGADEPYRSLIFDITACNRGTFTVANPDDQFEMTFNVQVLGDDPSICLHVQTLQPEGAIPVEGTEISNFRVAVFSDLMGADDPSNYVPIIFWGDETFSIGSVSLVPNFTGIFAVTASHTYREAGFYNPFVLVLDIDGSLGGSIETISVADALLPATAFDVTAPAGDPFTQTMATFTDANPFPNIDDFTATIDWGDGSTSSGTITADPSVPGQFDVTDTHDYSETGTIPVNVTIADAGGSSVSASSSAHINSLIVNGDSAVLANTIELDTASGQRDTYEVWVNGQRRFTGLWANIPGGITINPGDALGSATDIEDTVAGVPVKVNLASFGNSTVDISPTAMNLDNIQGPVTVVGSGGRTLLNQGNLIVNDQAYPFAAAYATDGGSLSRADLNYPTIGTTGTISYSGLDSVTLNGTAYIGQWTVANTESMATTTIHPGNGPLHEVDVLATTGSLNLELGTGANEVNVSPTAQNLETIQGSLMVNGMGSGILTLDDLANPWAYTYTLTDSSVSRSSVAGIDYSGLSDIALNGGRGLGRTYEVTNTAGRATTTVNTANGDDVINVEATTGELSLNLAGSGDPTVNISPTSRNLDTDTGNIFIHGNNFGSVNLDDDLATGTQTYVLNASVSSLDFYSLTRASFGGLTFGDVGNLALDVAPGTALGNYQSSTNVIVLATPAGTTTTINAATGANNITVGLPTNPAINTTGLPGSPLENIQGPVTVMGDYQDNLNLWDWDSSTAQKTYAINSNSIAVTKQNGVTLANPVPISWQGNLSTVVLFGSAAADTYQLQAATTNLAALVVDGYYRQNTFQSLLPDRHTWLIYPNGGITTAASPGHYVIFGEVWNFTGGPGGDDFLFLPNYGVDGKLDGVLTGNGGTLDYSQDSSPVTVNLAKDSASNIDGGAAGGLSDGGAARRSSGISAVIGNNKSTTLVGPNLDSTWNITGASQGTVSQPAVASSSVSFSQVPNLTGGDANDTFIFQQAVSISGTLDGGAGTNTLDYSQYSGNILVDLLLGSATATGGIARVQQVNGSVGNDLIVGNANPSTLKGGTGRNVLIGGAGQATLDASGGTSDNILIGGRTDWDLNLAALEAIMAEWDRTDLRFGDRRSDLLNGTNGQGKTPLNIVNGQLILLTPATNPTSTNGTVHANAFADTLIGSNAIDPATGKRVHNWFLYALSDVIENYVASSDRKNRIR
jgi:hypothetical protein